MLIGTLDTVFARAAPAPHALLSLAPCRSGTLRPLPTDALAIPMLCLGGRLPDKQGAIITLDLSNAAAAPGGGAAADLTAWGEFHNGVAAGERLACQWNKLCSARHAGCAEVVMRALSNTARPRSS